MAARSKQLFIGPLAKLARVSVDTVRYYEKIGLLPRAERTASGYRIYNAPAADRLLFIQKAQKLGFTLDEIKQVLDLRGTGTLPCEEVISMGQQRLDAVEMQLAALTALRDSLRKYVRRWKRNTNAKACAATQFCNLIEEIDLA